MENRNNEQIVKIFLKIKRKLKNMGVDYANDYDIYDEIDNAIEVVNSKRRFQPTSNILFEEKYTGLIVRLCIASISKWGAEGETSHSENNIVRNYEGGSEYPESMLSQIVPLGKARK